MAGYIVSTLSALAEPVIKGLGYEFWGCILAQGGRRQLLRVYIDSPNGINVEDCALVSRQLSAVLDVEDPLKGNYTLEVSSPGMDRPLFTIDQCQRYVGQTIKIQLREPVEGRRHYRGTLKSIIDDKLCLLVDENKEMVFPFFMVEKANLVPSY